MFCVLCYKHLKVEPLEGSVLEGPERQINGRAGSELSRKWWKH